MGAGNETPDRLNCPKALIQDSSWGVMVGYAPETHSAFG